jgi:hypothetical protein
MTIGSIEVKPQETGSERPVDTAAKPAAPASNERPAWLPQNFKSVEQFAESYKEQQATITRLQQEKAEAKKGEPGTPPDVKPDPAKAEDAKVDEKVEEKVEEKVDDKTDGEKKPEEKVADDLKADGIDVDAMSERFWKTGEIEAEDRKTLVEALAPKFGDKAEKLLDTFAESQKLAREYTELRLYEPVGGKAEGEKMIEWAKSNLTKPQAEAINTLWASDSLDSRIEGSRLLKTYFDAKNGRAPAVVLDGGAPAQSTDVYASMHEMTKDMGAPEYKTDPDFRARVMAKAARSKI